MQVINYSDFRKTLAKSMDNVIENNDPLLVTRGKKEPVMVISLSDFNSYEETDFLLRNEKNRKRLLAAVERVKRGEYKKRELIKV